jgi:UDP-glucose:(heptosyl)LPS alpha-1,3-glucosyltransferase
VLLFVGQDAGAGGLDRVIRALARVREEQPSANARLLVVGQAGPRQAGPRQIRQLARKLDTVEAIEFLGARDDLPDLMLVADVLVHPARRERDALAPLEALVTGLPVVVSEDCGCAQHIRDSRGGIILPAQFDQDLLERAVLRMLDGIYRADCRESARMYLRLTDLYTLYSTGADCIERLIATRRQGRADQAASTLHK